MSVIRPLISAMVLCDDAQSQPDGSLHLLQVRHRVQTGDFPYSHSQLCAYLELIGHRASDPCLIVAARGSNDAEVFHSPVHSVYFDGPLTVMPVLFRMRDCPFPEAGLYWIQFYWRDELLAEHRFEVST